MKKLLRFSVLRFADGEARYQVKALPIKCSHYVWREICALGELACLEQRLRTPQQTYTRIERHPDGQPAVPSLPVAACEFEFRQLANHNGIVRLGTLKVFKTLEHGIEGERRPVLGDESY